MKNNTKKPIGTIAEERRACITAFKKYPHRKWVWCCHHEELCENNEGYQRRLRHIKHDKLPSQQAVRYRNYRPVKNERAFENAAIGSRRSLMDKEWPNNTWGYVITWRTRRRLGTIFSAVARKLDPKNADCWP